MRRASIMLALLVSLSIFGAFSQAMAAETLTTSVSTHPAQDVYSAGGSGFEIRIVLRFNESLLKTFSFNYAASGGLNVSNFRANGAVASSAGSTVTFNGYNDMSTWIIIAADCVIAPGTTTDQSFGISNVIGKNAKTAVRFPSASTTVRVESVEVCTHPNWIASGESSATCTQAGEQVYHCADCTERKTELSPARGHDEYWKTVKDANCDQTGAEQLLCRRCDISSLGSREIPIVEHSFSDDWMIDAPATCTQAGTKSRKCSFGLHSQTMPYGGAGHSYDAPVIVKAATCLISGKQQEVCSVCDDIKVSDTPLAAHTLGAWLVAVDATCTDSGLSEQHCTLCDKLLNEIIMDAKGHDLNEPEVFPDDCEASNRFAVSACKRCPYKLTEAVAATTHDFVISTIPAGCGKDGLETSRCKRCAVTRQVTLPGRQHVYSEYITQPVPDCITIGYSRASCIYCGHEDRIELGKNEWHDYRGAWMTTQEPSCTRLGERTTNCLRCDKPYKEALGMIQHAYGDWVNAPGYSCTDGGRRSRQCIASDCLEAQTEHVQPGKAHEWGGWVEIQAPLCMEPGKEERACRLCLFTEPGVIAKRGHDYGAWVETITPTCTERGERRMYCRRSGCSASYGEGLVPLRHDEAPGVEDDIVSCTQARSRRFSCKREDCSFVRLEVIAAGTHRPGDWQTTLTPDCVLAGEEARGCELCPYVETKAIRQLGHNLNGAWYTTQEPSCTAKGEQAIDCARCDYVYLQPIAMDAHTYEAWDVTRHASCVAQGSRTRMCKVCQEPVTEIIAPTPHDCPKTEVVEAATCTGIGREEGLCRYCSNMVAFVVPAKGHSYDQWAVSQPAQCDIPGEETRYCDDCEQSEARPTIQLFHVYGSKQIIREAGCVQEGLSSKVCTLCDRLFENPIAATGHSYGKWEQAAYADCLQGGTQSRHCLGCDSSESRPAKATQHHYRAWVIVNAASCQAEGQRVHVCRRCQAEESQTLPVRKHAYGRWITDIAASCTLEGKQTRVCKTCPDEQTRSRPLKRHWAGKWQVGTAAGLDNPGEKIRPCRRCGTVMARRAYSLPRSHFAVSFCALGLPLSELQHSSQSTSWYMLTPIDLRQDGEHSYPLIADNSHCVGEATAVVAEGNVTVSYRLYADSTELFKPSLRIILSVDQLTDKELLSRRGQRRFDQLINIEKNLKGADLVYMALRLEGLYDKQHASHTIFGPGMPLPNDQGSYADALQAMRDLVRLRATGK